MKKTRWGALGLGLLLLLGGIAWFFFFREPPFHRAEELLPSHTIVFFDLPHTGASREQFRLTALGKIWAEPELKAFWEKPRQAIQKSVSVKDYPLPIFREILDMLATADGEAFMAITDIGIIPRLDVAVLIGFDPGKRRKEAEAALDQLIARCRAEYPSASVEERDYESVRYHVWNFSSSLKIAFAHVGNFLLFSHGEGPIQQAIARACATTEDCLKDAPLFASQRSKLAGADVALFLNPQALLGKFQLALQSLGADLPIQSFLGTSTFKDRGVEDHWWWTVPPAKQAEIGLADFKKCQCATLKAAGSDALIYAAMNFDLSTWFDRLLPGLDRSGLDSLRQQIQWLLKFLEAQGFRLREDLMPQLGPEMAFIMEWKATSLSPQISILIETRNPAAIRTAIEKLFRLVGNQQSTAQAPFDITTGPLNIPVLSLNLPGVYREINPSFAVFEGFAILSLDRASLETVIQTLSGHNERLSSRKEFQKLDARFEKDYCQIVYCDQRRLFERAYNLLSGMASFAPLMFPETRNYMDPAKLPRTDNISRHLFPSIWIASAGTNGFHQASFGPVSFQSLVLGTAGAGLNAMAANED